MTKAPGLAGVMISNHFWLTDEQLERLRLFFPRSHCKPRIDGRRVFSGLIFIGSIGLRWCDALRESYAAIEVVHHTGSARWLRNRSMVNRQQTTAALIDSRTFPAAKHRAKTDDVFSG